MQVPSQSPAPSPTGPTQPATPSTPVSSRSAVLSAAALPAGGPGTPGPLTLQQLLDGTAQGVAIDLPLATPAPSALATPSPSPRPSPATATGSPAVDALQTERSIRAFTLAQQALYNRQYEEALLAINQAIALDPHSGIYLALRGSILYATGDYNAARISWRMALALDPGLDQVREMLARIGDGGMP